MTSRPRGRPRSFDPDVALASAAERFRTAGFEGTSLDDLAAATGLNRPSLYAAFGDKRALYLATLDRTIDRLGRAFERLLAARMPLRALVETIFASTISGYLTGEKGPSGCIAVSTAATAAVEDPQVRTRLAAFLALEDRGFERLFEAAGDTDAAIHAPLVAAMIHSLSVRARAGASRDDLERLAASTVNLIAPRESGSVGAG